LFVLFAALAAPLEYHVKWLAPWTRGLMDLSEALDAPLIHGALFFYSIIVAIEALFRLEMHPDRAARPASYVLKAFCFFVPLVFAVYLVRGFDEPLVAWWITLQWYLAMGSFLLSVSVFVYLQRADKIVNQMPLS
jgi:hypothetical protein